MTVSYSKRSDVLYIVISKPDHACRYVELPGGVITRIDESTEKVVGVTIYGFMAKIESGAKISIPEIGDDLSGITLLNLYQHAS